jgi:hypothetical protein
MKRDRWNYHSNSLHWRLGGGTRMAAVLLLLFMLLMACAFFAPIAHGQMLKVKEFGGADVAGKTTAAQSACQTIPCVLTFEPEMAGFPTGSMPARCGTCTWLDYRTPGVLLVNGLPVGTGGAPRCEYYGTPGVTPFQTLMANCVAALPTTGAGVVDATNITDTTNLTMTGDWTPNRVGTTYLFGQYKVLMGTFRIVFQATVNNITLRGPSPFASSQVPCGSINPPSGTCFIYTGNGSALQLGDNAATSYGHHLEDIAVDLTGANTVAIGVISTRVYQTDFVRLRIFCIAGASSQTGLINEGTSTAPGSQSMLLYMPYIAGCNTAALFKATGAGSPLNNMNVTIGGYLNGSGQAGSIGVDIENGNNHWFYGTVIANHGTAIKQASPSAGALQGFVHIESSVTQAFNFTAGTSQSFIVTDTADTVTDAGSYNTVWKTLTGAAGSKFYYPTTLYSQNKMLFNTGNPSIASGFGASPSVVSSNGTPAFTVNVGTGAAATSGALTMPTASTGWMCSVNDITTPATNLTRVTGTNATQVTVTNYNNAGTITAWPASDILQFICHAY